MNPTYTGSAVKSNLTALKKAVSGVIKANKSWLLALAGLLEGPNASAATSTIKSALPSSVQNVLAGQDPTQAQVIRLALDEMTLLQLADRKLEGKVAQLEPTSENLGKAIVESEAYLVVTDEAFTFLHTISGAGVINIDSTSADGARNGLPKLKLIGLAPQVAALLSSSSSGTTLQLPELEGTELLLDKSLGHYAHGFLGLMPQGVTETTQTQKLLSGGRLTLSDKQINVLTNSWGQAVKQATDDLANSTSEPPFTIADLFGIHTTLETLYDRLETNVTRSDVDIVSLEI